MLRAVVVDTRDAPLSATEETLCVEMAPLVLRGLGTIALDHPHAKLCAEGPGAAALRAAARAIGAELGDTAPGERLVVRPSVLVEKMRPTHDHALSIAGAVGSPRVVFAGRDATVASLVDSTVRAWVALFGGAEVDREATIGDLVAERPVAARLLLVLPARHAAVRRARTSTAALVRQVRSACASCGACAPVCPSNIAVPALLRSLTGTRRTRVPALQLATAASCSGCAACDLACPVSLSPSRLIGEIGQRLRDRGVPVTTSAHPVPVLDADVARLRAGLGRYARPVSALRT